MYPQAECLARQDECIRAGLATRFHLPINPGFVEGKTYSLSYKYFGIRTLTPKMIEKYHKAGVKTLAFLPAKPIEFKAAFESKVDEILCDGPIPKYI